MEVTHKFDLKYKAEIDFADCFTGKSVNCNIIIKENNIPLIELSENFYKLNNEEKAYFKFMVNKLKKYIDEI